MADQLQATVQLLVERGLLSQDAAQQVEARSAASGTPATDILREERLVAPDALAQVISAATGVPYVDLTKVAVKESAMADIARKAAATYRFVAFDQQNDKLLVALENPLNFQALEAIKFIARKRGLSPQIYVASAEAIEKILGGSIKIQAEIGGALQDFSKEVEAAAKVEGASQSEKDIERYLEEAPVTKVVAVMIRHAIEGNASDIHVEPTEKQVRIRYRVDGNLRTSLFLPRKVHAAIVSRIKILSNLKIDETRLPQDGRFSITAEGRAFDFRVAIMPTAYGEKAALRLLDKTRGAPSLEELGVTGPVQKIFQQHLNSPHGIILISGPTGAGKSTTLFSALSTINDPVLNIVTLEDPIEYEIEGVNQTQVHPEIGLSFASGLRSILRQDPDIIMVGEIRDGDTAGLAVHAALTGHLVLSTIHTNDAIGVIPRLIDMGIDPFLLAASLRLLAAQRLVMRLCQECKQEVE
ncbi:MAG: ATPase, T2SS/T4P/T4SS family, partial [Patescibacteria group bacterium]